MTEKKNSYAQIVKAASLIGGAQWIVRFIGIFRVKVVAIFLGPYGVGLSGTYSSLIQLCSTLALLGMGPSGVREAAAAIGTGDQETVGRTVLILRRMCWLTGTVGALVVSCLALPLSRLTFGADEHAWAIVLLSWTILMHNVQNAQKSYLKALKRVGDIARLSVIGAVGGGLISIPLYVWLGVRGVVPALFMLGVFNTMASWWYARKVPPPRILLTWRETLRSSKGLIKLGLAFMWNGFLKPANAYLTRLLINRELTMASVGIFQAAFRISALFVSFILSAMVIDYYPRLSAVSSDHAEMKRLANEQTEIGLLIATPGIIATLAFAPLIIRIFYTSKFLPSIPLLEWFVLGCLVEIISWPMKFFPVAKGAGRWLVVIETSFNALHLLFIWLGMKAFGIEGVAIAFLAAYVIYTIAMLRISRYMIDFSWNSEVRTLLWRLIPFTGAVFLCNRILPEIPATIIGGIASIAVGLYCVRELAGRLGSNHKVCRLLKKTPGIALIMPHEQE